MLIPGDISKISMMFCAALSITTAVAQNYPTRPIRFLIGPGPDVVARVIGQKLTDRWGQQIVIDQRPGAGGAIAGETIARAQADGYTWLLSTPSFTILQALNPKLPYRFAQETAGVTQMATVPFILFVHPSLAVTSVDELVRLARAKPGQLNFASSGTGTTAHLALELLKSMTRVNMVHVPYKGLSPAIIDLMSGQAQALFVVAQAGVPLVKSDKLRALAVSGAKRAVALPNLPTIAESGLPGYDFVTWNGVHVPVGTPRPLIATINAEINQIIKLPDVRDRLTVIGLELTGTTPEAFDEIVHKELAAWVKLVKGAGIRLE